VGGPSAESPEPPPLGFLGAGEREDERKGAGRGRGLGRASEAVRGGASEC
jgi:hypothetical protein